MFIMAFTPAVAPSDKARREALTGFAETGAKVYAHMQKNGISADEFDAAVDEAVEHIRRRED